MVERRRLPAIGGMASRAICPKLTVVLVILGMAGRAVLRCLGKQQVRMARATFHRDMFASQGKRNCRMVEGDLLPIVGDMTGRTSLAQFALVRVLFAMARETIFGGGLEQIIGMARPTFHLDVFAGQQEERPGVVEGRQFPVRGGMAGRAILVELTLVDIVLSMTGDTILRGVFEQVVEMAIPACNGCMLSEQREKGLRVIVSHGLPVLGGMASRTVLA